MRQPLRHLQSSAAPPLNTSRIWPASHDKPSLADIGHAFNESHGYSRSLSPDDGVENALASYIGGLAEAEREVEIAGWLGGGSRCWCWRWWGGAERVGTEVSNWSVLASCSMVVWRLDHRLLRGGFRFAERLDWNVVMVRWPGEKIVGVVCSRASKLAQCSV